MRESRWIQIRGFPFQILLRQHESKWYTSIKMTCRIKSGQESPNRTEQNLPKVEALFILVMFIKLSFRQINIVCIRVSFLLIAKADNFVTF